MPNQAGNAVVSKMLKSYYSMIKNIAPDRVSEREFGFGNFESKIAFRHMAFKDEAALQRYATDTAPAFIDYSAAYYKIPDGRPMEKKGWLGSELRFDIDSNDIPAPCKLDHGKEWVCGKCLDAAKQEVFKLVENFLVPDFGFSEQEIEINFSGNRGYHLHIRKPSILMLDSGARDELSNYVFGQEPDFESFFYTEDLGHNRRKQFGPKPSDGGWRGKVAKAFLSAASSKEDLMALGIDKTTASWIFRNIAQVREKISTGNWDFYSIPKRQEVFATLLHNQAVKQGNRIDKGVTRDPSHLMRLPNTIHGGTGLIAKKIPSMSALEIFDPMKGAIAFKTGELKVRADSKYKLLINGEDFGPFRNATVRLPTYAATYLYLKGQADMLPGS